MGWTLWFARPKMELLADGEDFVRLSNRFWYRLTMQRKSWHMFCFDSGMVQMRLCLSHSLDVERATQYSGFYWTFLMCSYRGMLRTAQHAMCAVFSYSHFRRMDRRMCSTQAILVQRDSVITDDMGHASVQNTY